MKINYPPYKITDKMLNYVSDIMKKSEKQIEFVFIHPFHDGNGRTARLWQTAILSHWEEPFKFLPIESMIKKNQEEYYSAIQNCNNAGESTEFIEFMLKMIDNTIDEMNNAKDIIKQTGLSDSTVRRTLRKFLKDKKIQTTNNNEKSPNKKYKLTE